MTQRPVLERMRGRASRLMRAAVSVLEGPKDRAGATLKDRSNAPDTRAESIPVGVPPAASTWERSRLQAGMREGVLCGVSSG